ncbi:odorant receptor 13a-like [Neodiprion pinetum]|uniref:odorant receptor 13a-like n=1 Tax=Neodiprion pinetum TaxID=441929 RepID=UPI003719D158
MEVSSTVKLLEWNEILLSLVGLWPLSHNDTRFTLGLSCLLIHVTLEHVDLYKNGKNFEHVVANLSENIMFTTILIEVTLLRVNSRKLGKIIRAVYEDFVEENYKTSTEKKILLDNFEKTRIFVVSSVMLILPAAVSYYLTPFINLLRTMNGNSTVQLELPYHTYIFYDVSKISSYAMTYAAQLPFVFFSAFGSIASICLVISLTLHVFGQLSVLAERINDVNTDGQECGLAIKTLVKNHVRLIRMTQTLEEVYNVMLLGQLLGGMILICILSYYVLANTEGEQNTDFVSFTLYVLSVIHHIFVYCYVGERLVQESTKVHDALSACRWYDMSSVHAKMLIVCMARSQKPLVLTAGKFCTFSMGSFANVMKTSMAYLSVLKSLL